MESFIKTDLHSTGFLSIASWVEVPIVLPKKASGGASWFRIGKIIADVLRRRPCTLQVSQSPLTGSGIVFSLYFRRKWNLPTRATRWSGLMPRSSCSSRYKLSPNRPAPTRSTTAVVAAPKSYLEGDKLMDLEQQIVSRIGNLPGAQSASISSHLPTHSWDGGVSLVVPGRPTDRCPGAGPKFSISVDGRCRASARPLFFRGGRRQQSTARHRG
jgi:hypothetical protein